VDLEELLALRRLRLHDLGQPLLLKALANPPVFLRREDVGPDVGFIGGGGDDAAVQLRTGNHPSRV
jgi:hypothetical protein